VSSTRVRYLTLGVRLLFFTLAVLVLRRELAGLDRLDLVAGFQSYGAFQIAAALGFTAASFVALGGLELLALRHIEEGSAHIVRPRTAMRTAFIAHAFSQSIGFAILTGAVIRLRAYIRYGVDAVTVARLSTLVTVAMTLGLLAITGIALLTDDAIFATRSRVSEGIAGALLILLPLAYLAWSVFGRQSGIGRGSWRVPRPPPSLAGGQIALSALDWLITGMVLFLLLPPSFAAPYGTFLAAYMLAQTVGFVSQIPGGIGAFDATLLALLAPFASSESLAAALVIYRVIYYLVPLCGAVVVVAFGEWGRRTVMSAAESQSA
jgi:uncharacterized membrane protein YbhN (UPF0104 family)